MRESLGFTLVVEGSRAAAEAENPGELVLPGLFDDLVAEAQRPRPPGTGGATAGDLPLAHVPPILRHHVDAQLAPEDYGLPALAVTWLERGLAAGPPSDDARQALQYELGHAPLQTASRLRGRRPRGGGP